MRSHTYDEITGDGRTLILIGLDAYLMSDQLQVVSVLQSFNVFAAPLGLKLSWPKTKLQNLVAGDPPSTILIDGVPVEGVEEFIYLGNKQSSNGATADWMFYAGLDLPVQ